MNPLSPLVRAYSSMWVPFIAGSAMAWMSWVERLVIPNPLCRNRRRARTRRSGVHGGELLECRLLLSASGFGLGLATQEHSVARLWNEAMLEAIRIDTPRQGGRHAGHDIEDLPHCDPREWGAPGSGLAGGGGRAFPFGRFAESRCAADERALPVLPR